MILNADRTIFGDRNLAPQAAAVRINADRIDDIGSLDKLTKMYPADDVIHYPNASLLPGLIDMHTHVGYDGAPDLTNPDHYFWSVYAYARLHAGLQSGVTTVRDVGSPDGLAKAIKKAAAQGLIRAPRIITCNQGICMTGGHGAGTGMCVERDGEWEIRKEIRHQIKRGAQWIKILTSEGWRGEEYSQAELNAAVEEAHRLHTPIAAHAGCAPSVKMCIAAGFDSIEHGTFMAREDADTMKANGQTWVPTILAFTCLVELLGSGGDYLDGAASTYAVPALKKYEDNFKQFYDTGVRVACGTDMVLAGKPAMPVGMEAACMVRYGITPLQAIEAATKNGADALRLGDRLGQVKKGYLADLLVVEGNPAEDISALQRVRAVYFEGHLVSGA